MRIGRSYRWIGIRSEQGNEMGSKTYAIAAGIAETVVV